MIDGRYVKELQKRIDDIWYDYCHALNELREYYRTHKELPDNIYYKNETSDVFYRLTGYGKNNDKEFAIDYWYTADTLTMHGNQYGLQLNQAILCDYIDEKCTPVTEVEWKEALIRCTEIIKEHLS